MVCFNAKGWFLNFVLLFFVDGGNSVDKKKDNKQKKGDKPTKSQKNTNRKVDMQKGNI
jgi:hypothetical protein